MGEDDDGYVHVKKHAGGEVVAVDAADVSPMPLRPGLAPGASVMRARLDGEEELATARVAAGWRGGRGARLLGGADLRLPLDTRRGGEARSPHLTAGARARTRRLRPCQFQSSRGGWVLDSDSALPPVLPPPPPPQVVSVVSSEEVSIRVHNTHAVYTSKAFRLRVVGLAQPFTVPPAKKKTAVALSLAALLASVPGAPRPAYCTMGESWIKEVVAAKARPAFASRPRLVLCRANQSPHPSA